MTFRMGFASLFLLIFTLTFAMPMARAGCVSLDENGNAKQTASLNIKSSGSPAMISWLRARALNVRNQAFSESFANAVDSELVKDLIEAVYNIELARIAHTHEAAPVIAYNGLKQAQAYIDGTANSGPRQNAQQILVEFIDRYSSEKMVCAEINNADFLILIRSLRALL